MCTHGHQCTGAMFCRSCRLTSDFACLTSSLRVSCVVCRVSCVVWCGVVRVVFRPALAMFEAGACSAATVTWWGGEGRGIHCRGLR